MATRFVNISDTVQVVYDQSMTKFEVVPGGTVMGDKAHFATYGCLKEVVEAPVKTGRKALVEDAKV